MKTQHNIIARAGLLLLALVVAGISALAGTVTLWDVKGNGRVAEVQFANENGGGKINLFQNGNSTFMFYEIWGNDLTSQNCSYYTDDFGNLITICTYTRFFYSSGWGEIPSSEIEFTATGAHLVTTTGAGFSDTRCTTDFNTDPPTTTCGPSAGGSFDLTWESNNLSTNSTAGVTQYAIGPFTFTSQGTVLSTSAYVDGNALGRSVAYAPGRLGTTKIVKNVATEVVP